MAETETVISMECNMAAVLLAALHLYSHTLSVFYLVSLSLSLLQRRTHISRGHKSAKECCWDKDTLDRTFAVFGENADVPASSASSSVSHFTPPPLLHFILSISLQSFCLMFLTPFNLNLDHISSTLCPSLPFPLSLFSKSRCSPT